MRFLLRLPGLALPQSICHKPNCSYSTDNRGCKKTAKYVASCKSFGGKEILTRVASLPGPEAVSHEQNEHQTYCQDNLLSSCIMKYQVAVVKAVRINTIATGLVIAG